MSGLAPRWQPPARSASARALYAEAEAERSADPGRFRLSGAALVSAHLKRFPDAPGVPEGLVRLADEAGESGRLNALGARAIRRLLGSLAVKRDRLAAVVDERPDIAVHRVHSPIFILGGWRTGSTLLHRTLASLPGLRAPAFWEWADPFAAAIGTAEAKEAAVASAERGFAAQYRLNPLKENVHPASATLAEECVVGMGADGRNWALPSSVWVPGYAHWLETEDFTESYQLHRTILALLAHGGEDTWVLKAPAHTAELAALLGVYPDARVIHLHRDVVDVVAAAAHLFSVFQSTYSDEVDAYAVGRHQLETLSMWFERARRTRAEAATTARFLDVRFSELVTDLEGTIARVLSWLGLDPALACGAQEGSAPHHARYRYHLGEFGLTAGEVRERMKLYLDTFEV